MGANFLKLFRQPPPWLRMALAGLLLAFTLDVLAHSLHRHEHDQHAHHTSAGPDCAYCVAFNGLMDAPTGVSTVFEPACRPAPAPLADDACLPLQPETSAQPRAPPAP